MGLDMRNQKIVERDRKWEEEYMPAFRDLYRDTGHINAPRSHPILGHLMNDIRMGHIHRFLLSLKRSCWKWA